MAMAGEARYDVLIAGGGMVGASLAVALAQLPLSIALVEAVPFPVAGQPSFDARTIALSRSTQRILASLGVWAGFGSACCPIRRIHVSEQGRFGTALIDAAEEGVPALGYVVENRVLGAALWAAIAARPNITVLSPATVAGFAVEADGVRCSVAAGQGARAIEGQATDSRDLVAGLLVVADGAKSALRTAAGIRASARPYGQTAIIGNLAVTSPPSPPLAYERFTPEGPLALLPIGGGRYAFVLTRATGSAPAVLALPDDEFLALLQRAFGRRLGRFSRLGQRSAYPLELVVAEAVTAPRIALVGNAAHGLHPVAGQGYNLGLRDVAVLAEVIADHWRAGGGDGGHDAGDPAVLARYADWRRVDQRNVVAFTDGLIRFFGLEVPALGALRGAGLAAFDILPGAKAALARQTMGLGGRLTRLVRGLPL